MIYSIKGRHSELTPSISQYVEKKLKSLTKYFHNIIRLDVEVQKTSQHHNKGKIFKVDANLQIPGKLLRAEHVADDLYAAIDYVQYELKRELLKAKEKKLSDRKKAVVVGV